MSPAFLFVHLLLAVAAAFLIGVRAFRATHPERTPGDEEVRQLHRLANHSGAALLLLAVAIVLALDRSFFQVVKALQ